MGRRLRRRGFTAFFLLSAAGRSAPAAGSTGGFQCAHWDHTGVSDACNAGKVPGSHALSPGPW